jgi:SHS2 domain-containing protein
VRYEQIEHADDRTIVRVHGATLEELIENAAYAVFDQGYVLEAIPATYSRPVVSPGDDPADQIACWLEEVLAMSRAERLVPSYFVIDRLEEGGVQGSAAGLPVAQAPRRGPAVAGVERPIPPPVEIPAGWWVDVALLLEPRFRVI